MSSAPNVSGAADRVSDELRIVSEGVSIAGWTSIRVSRSIENVASDFEVSVTENFPGTDNAVSLIPGAPVEVRIGDDLVLTGYVDSYRLAQDARSHTIVASGRSKTQDLVDCSAVWPSMQMRAADVATVAQNLASAYGIQVVCNLDDLVQLPQFNINKGESCFEIIDRWALFSAVLAYDDPEGRLVLARTERGLTGGPAPALKEGVNVEASSVEYSASQRFSRYDIYTQSPDKLRNGEWQQPIYTATDPGVRRDRLKFLLADHVQWWKQIAVQRVNWEANRRLARSAVVTVITDSWRNGTGALWAPNTLVTLDLPSMKLPKVRWLIGSVNYTRDASGTHAELTIMEPEGFAPQPTGYGKVLIDGYTGEQMR